MKIETSPLFKSSRLRHTVAVLSFVLLCILGLFQALHLGAPDFKVFYFAGGLAGSGNLHLIYQQSPDRFLYAPIAVFLFLPFAFFSFKSALFFWCLLKSLCLGHFLFFDRKIQNSWGKIFFWLLAFRFLLMDFRYGQINFFVFYFSWQALAVFCQTEISSVRDSWRIFLGFFFAVVKLYSLPLFVVAFFVQITRKNRLHRVILPGGGVLLLGFAIFFDQGINRSLALLNQWREALASRGLPLETHNQSFLATISRFFSEQKFYSLMNGPNLLHLTVMDLPRPVLHGAGVVFSAVLVVSTMLGFYQFALHKNSEVRWRAPVIGLSLFSVVLASHLIWKPYFLMLMGLSPALFYPYLRHKGGKFFFLALTSIVLINLPFIWHPLRVYFEAIALNYWFCLALVGMGWLTLVCARFKSRQLFPSRAAGST